MFFMAKIKGEFNWRSPQVIPAFVEGSDAENIYKALEGLTSGTMGYNEKTQTFYGSTPFVAARIDTLVRPLGIRVATLRDLSRPEVMEMVKGQFYSDTPALVARSAEDSYSRNQAILNKLVEEVEKREGKVQFPFMVTGFNAVKNPDDNGYGVAIVPREDFAILHDERLESKYHGKSFSNADDQGLPNFDKKGNRTWYARDKGLSRLSLNGNLDLDSNYENLSDSVDYGRVVLVSGEAAAPVLVAQYSKKARELVNARKSELDRMLSDFTAKLPKAN